MRRKRQEGQAMVEFALVLPILILLVCGIIDFGWIFGNQIIANNAVREAARYTAIHYEDYAGDDGAAGTKALSIIQAKAQNLEGPTLQGSLKTGEDITINVKGTIPVLTPFTSLFLTDEYTMTAKSVMRIE